VVVVMENHGFDQIVAQPDASYLNAFAAGGTLFTNMRAVTHPSLPNYLAMTSGSTQGCAGNECAPASFGADNVFHQLQAAGGTWESWQESMPSPCLPNNSGDYVVRHNPAAFFTNLLPEDCPRFDIPFPALIPAELADLTFVTPNLCNDMHDCSVATGDAWLRGHVPPLLALGATVVITFDEDEGGGGGNRIYCAARGPGIERGETVSTPLSHYSVLAGIERHFSLPLLGEAATAHPLPI
jgi:hypothetical protein